MQSWSSQISITHLCFLFWKPLPPASGDQLNTPLICLLNLIKTGSRQLDFVNFSGQLNSIGSIILGDLSELTRIQVFIVLFIGDKGTKYILVTSKLKLDGTGFSNIWLHKMKISGKVPIVQFMLLFWSFYLFCFSTFFSATAACRIADCG